MASSTKARRTFHLKVVNNRGKVVEERDLNRNSQWSAHQAARGIFREQPAGSKMDLLLGDRVLEHWTMTREGYEFQVMNGDSLAAASRSLNKATTRKVTKPKSTKRARKAA